MLEKLKVKIKRASQEKRIKKCKPVADSLMGKKFSIIASSCLSGIIYHDLQKQFLTPTINLNFRNKDFYYFAANLEKYIDADLEEFIIPNSTYPHAVIKVEGLPDVVMNFPHDKDFGIVKENWNRRKVRINFEYIRVMAVQQIIDQQVVDLFEKIPYKKVLFYGINNGAVLTKDCAFNDFLKRETQTTTRSIAGFAGLSTKRNFDSFDWATFLKE